MLVGSNTDSDCLTCFREERLLSLLVELGPSTSSGDFASARWPRADAHRGRHRRPRQLPVFGQRGPASDHDREARESNLHSPLPWLSVDCRRRAPSHRSAFSLQPVQFRRPLRQRSWKEQSSPLEQCRSGGLPPCRQQDNPCQLVRVRVATEQRGSES